MADSRVEVTSGTGTSIDTRTESTNGHHRQVVVVGDPTNNAGVAPVDATNGLAVDVTRLPYAGQQSMSSSIPVAIASNQSDLPVVNTDTLGENTVYTTGDPTRLAGYIAKSTPTQLVTGDGRYSVPQTTLKGEVYVKQTDAVPVTDNSGSITIDGTVSVTGVATATKQDTGNTSLASIDTKLPSQGQALAAASLPVVLPAAQITTLTPPAAITGYATSTKQSDGSQKTQVVDGSGNVIGATSNALDINIKSGNPTSITANAGTNLNTSALALESGGNLATIAGAVRAEDAASADGHTGIPALAVRKATPANTSGTDGDYENLQMSAGRLWVDASGKTLTVDGSAVTQPVSLASVPSHAVTNAGTFAVQESGSALTALQLIDDVVYTDDTSTHSTGSSKGTLFMAAATPTDASVNANDIGAVAMTTDRKLHVSVQDSLPAGTNAIGKLAANSGVDIGDVDVTSLPALPSGTNTIGYVNLSASSTNTGLSVSKTDAQTATVTAVKASGGRVHGYHIYNPNSADAYLHFYDTASASVTVGTTTRIKTLWIPAGGAIDMSPSTFGITFSTAISIAATTTITGSSAPSTGLLVNVDYI